MKMRDFVGNKKKFFIVSIVMILLGIIGVIVVGGPTLSIDYQGGAVIEIGVPTSEYDIPEIEDLIKEKTGNSATIQKAEYDYKVDEASNIVKETARLDLRIKTDEKLTEDELRKVSKYLSDNYAELISIAEPAYHEAVAPFTAQYLVNITSISTDEAGFKTAINKIQTDIAELLSKKADTEFSYVFGPDALTVKKYMINIKIASTDKILSAEDINAVKNVIADKFEIVISENPVDYSFSNVSPNVGREMLKNGMLAILIASILMIIYIWLRFKTISGLSAGVVSVIALLHDVILMFLVFVIFGFTLNESFISAVLTILGYSINNTIVIFDRIRENMNLDSKMPLEEVVNTSINQTLKRCIITSACVMSSLIIVLGFSYMNGLTTVVEFIFPLLIGSLAGFYSAAFVAPNIWVWYKGKNK